MSYASEEKLKFFKEYCKAKGIEDNFINYIVWKDKLKAKAGTQ